VGQLLRDLDGNRTRPNTLTKCRASPIHYETRWCIQVSYDPTAPCPDYAGLYTTCDSVPCYRPHL
jgi:hypothetical protein